MAYMDQKKKAELLPGIKAAMPNGWKYSVSVRHHSTLVLTIKSAPVDLLERTHRQMLQNSSYYSPDSPRITHCDVNVYHLGHHFEGDLLATFQQIANAMNIGNHDKSDLQSDYFNVGWHIDINIGRWDKPFQIKEHQ